MSESGRPVDGRRKEQASSIYMGWRARFDKREMSVCKGLGQRGNLFTFRRRETGFGKRSGRDPHWQVDHARCRSWWWSGHWRCRRHHATSGVVATEFALTLFAPSEYALTLFAPPFLRPLFGRSRSRRGSGRDPHWQVDHARCRSWWWSGHWRCRRHRATSGVLATEYALTLFAPPLFAPPLFAPSSCAFGRRVPRQT